MKFSFSHLKTDYPLYCKGWINQHRSPGDSGGDHSTAINSRSRSPLVAGGSGGDYLGSGGGGHDSVKTGLASRRLLSSSTSLPQPSNLLGSPRPLGCFAADRGGWI